MKHDCGTTAPDPWADARFLALLRGNRHSELEHELMILVHTPGIPIEWVYTVFRMSAWYRRRLQDRLLEIDRGEYEALGKANAGTVGGDDGWRMLLAIDKVDTLHGPVPLWTQLLLRQAPESDEKLAQVLGTNRQKVRRWRVIHVFDPLTGVRVAGRQGWPVGAPRGSDRRLRL